MANVDIRMPEEQKEGTESFVGAWLKHPGDAVEENEPLVEISTDKVTIEIAAPASGTLREIVKPETDPVAPGELLGRIETTQGNGADAPAEGKIPVPQVQEVESAAPLVAAANASSPAVRKLLRQHGLDPALIPASGRHGRITHQDVLDFLAARDAEPKPVQPGSGTAKTKIPSESKYASHRVPHSPMRRSIANHMTRSVLTAPHVTAVFEADLSRVLSERESCKASLGEEDVPSVTAYILRAVVQAIQAVPEVNSKWHEDALEIYDDVNLGFGAALEKGGLVVPVIHRAQTMELMELAKRLRDLTRKARNGKLTREDVDNGTFTVSNHGVSGSLLAAPIILSHGQSAILGVGKLQRRVIVAERDGKELLQIRPMMYVTLTVDHRALDGQQTNAFMTKFVRALESGNI